MAPAGLRRREALRALAGATAAAAAALTARRAFAQMPTTATRVIGGAPAGSAFRASSAEGNGARTTDATRLTGAEANRVARWLGGMEPLPTADPSAEWRAYAAQQDLAWRATGRRVRTLRSWAQRELAPLVPAGMPLLYPFSGPDALHALALFGDAPRLLLLGLEPVGALPSPSRVPDGYFDQLGSAMSDLHRLAYFRTRAMAADFDDDGVAGALAGTVARLLEGGAAVTALETGTQPPRAVVEWTTAEGAPRRLEYASVDVANAGLTLRRRFFADLTAGAPYVTFLKAASFLLGEARFSQTVPWIEEASAVIVQDDSGVPFHELEHGWALCFFGRYAAPGPPFRDKGQPALAAAFARRTPPRLPFALGYHADAQSSHLLVASKEH